MNTDEYLYFANRALDGMHRIVATAVLQDPPRRQPDGGYEVMPQPLTQAGVLLHVLEELCQHHGQMEIIRDALGAQAQRAGAPS